MLIVKITHVKYFLIKFTRAEVGGNGASLIHRQRQPTKNLEKSPTIDTNKCKTDA